MKKDKKGPKDSYPTVQEVTDLAKVEVSFVPGCKTEYRGPTDRTGSRIIGTHLNTKRRIIRPWRYELSADGNHRAVAAELLQAKGMLACSLNGGGYVFLKTDE
jgi:hypothetical protein